MITYTKRLDKAMRRAAWAHEQQNQHRKGTDIPYIIHPIGVMMIASNVTDDEDILIACLMHDILEDVDNKIYNAATMEKEFGSRVVSIVKDVTKDDSEKDWHKQSKLYLNHLEHNASDEALIVSVSDKMHNLLSTLSDYETHGNKLWERFTTKSAQDQLWWYESILEVIAKRNVSEKLFERFEYRVTELTNKVTSSLNP